MPQQSDIGILLSALGRGVETFAGAERLSREEKARRDAERISRNLDIAQLELQKHGLAAKAMRPLTPLQGLRGDVISGEVPIDDPRAQFLLGPKEKQLSPLQGLRRDIISGQIPPDDPIAQVLLNLGEGKGEDPNIEITRRENLKNKAEVRAAKKIKQKKSGIITEAQGLILKALRATTPEGDKVPKVTKDDALVRLVSIKGEGLDRLGDLSRMLFQLKPDSAGALSIRGKELGKVGLGELAPAIPKPKGVVRPDFRHPLAPVGGAAPKRQQQKGRVLKGGTASETAKQIVAVLKKQKGQIPIKKLRALNKGKDVDAIIREVDRIMGHKKWRKE